MATIDPTARYTNVFAAINGHIAGLSISGAPKIVLEGETGFVSADNEPWVRVTIDNVGQVPSGNFSSTQTVERVDLLVTVYVFFVDGTEAQPSNGYAVTKAADDVAHGLRLMSLAFSDYSDDPANPTDVPGARIRVIDPPSISRLPSVDGYVRRQVQAVAFWHARHTV